MSHLRFSFVISMHFWILMWGYVLLIFLERGREREKRIIDVKEKHGLVASCICAGQGLNQQPKCVFWLGSNHRAFDAQNDAPANRAAPGLSSPCFSCVLLLPALPDGAICSAFQLPTSASQPSHPFYIYRLRSYVCPDSS